MKLRRGRERDFHISVHKVYYRLVTGFETQAEAHIRGAEMCDNFRKQDPTGEYWFDVEMIEEESEDE
jgi:hypothetical protein